MEIEIPCSQWERSACTESGSIFFFKFWVGVAEDFFHSSFVPNMFPSSSQCVPNINSLESHMFCPQSSPFHLYTWAKGRGHPSFQRIFCLGGASIVSTVFCVMAQSNWFIAKRKKKVGHVRHPQLINMK